jgi:drug/metabolite transporter (DMT)-like permease
VACFEAFTLRRAFLPHPFDPSGANLPRRRCAEHCQPVRDHEKKRTDPAPVVSRIVASGIGQPGSHDMQSQSLLYLALTIGLSTYSQIIFRWRALAHSGAHAGHVGIAYLIAMLLDLWVLSGIAASGVALLAWMGALERVQLARGYAVLALLYVTVPVGAAYFFNERLLPVQVLGIVLIVIGVAMVGMGAR